MPYLNDDDGDSPSHKKYVATRVTLDMLSDGELVEELVERRCLLVVTAHRQVPRDVYTKPNFYSAVQALLACDLGKHLVSDNMIGEDVIQNKDYLEFCSTIVVLRTTKEERPI